MTEASLRAALTRSGGVPGTATGGIARIAVLVGAAAQTIFWIYTFTYIGQRIAPYGDGLEWLAAFPMALIFGVLTLPALMLGILGRAMPIGVIFTLGAAVANAWIWSEIVSEFAARVAPSGPWDAVEVQAGRGGAFGAIHLSALRRRRPDHSSSESG